MLDIKVFHQDNNRIVPGLSQTVTGLKGGGKLMQLVLKCLLTNPGTDQFEPEWGGGLVAEMPKIGGKQYELLAEAQAMIAVTKTEKDIKSMLSENVSDDEKLQSLTLRSVSFDEQALAWNVDISIRSVSGRVNVAEVSI